jgi:hypothetical protein
MAFCGAITSRHAGWRNLPRACTTVRCWVSSLYNAAFEILYSAPMTIDVRLRCRQNWRHASG